MRLHFTPHLSIADDASAFTTLTVDVDRVITSWRGSLFAFEWLNPDGTLRAPDQLKPELRAQRQAIESRVKQGQPIPRPVLGVGLLDCVEIGAGRDVLLTLAALGVDTVAVDVPTTMTKDFQKFIARKAERGNAMFYILIAIVLLAALSYAVSRTTGSGSVTHLSDSRAGIVADEVIHYADAVKNAVARLQLRGCTETQLSFQNPVVSGYTNGGAPGDQSCHVFDPAGGAIAWATPTADANDGSAWFFAGGPVVHQQGGFASTNANINADLVMMMFNVNPQVCAKIATKIGLAGVPVDDGQYTSTTKFTGSYVAADDINGNSGAAQPSPCIGAAAPAPNLCGLEAGCYREENGAQRYIFYQVLLQR